MENDGERAFESSDTTFPKMGVMRMETRYAAVSAVAGLLCFYGDQCSPRTRSAQKTIRGPPPVVIPGFPTTVAARQFLSVDQTIADVADLQLTRSGKMERYHLFGLTRRSLFAALAAIAVACSGIAAQAQDDPLPSWNDGSAKQAIIEFVAATTKEFSPTFVPPGERIATFDQDGTLWVEHPMYSQVVYCLERRP
jgi:hypothetical protein